MWVGLLTNRINNKLEKSNLINEHALNREPVPLTRKEETLPLDVPWHSQICGLYFQLNVSILFSVLLFSSGLLNNTASSKFSKRTVSS